MNESRAVSFGEEGEGHSMHMDRKQKRRGNQSEESGARNLEAEGIRNRYSAILHKDPRKKQNNRSTVCGCDSVGFVRGKEDKDDLRKK